VLSYLEDPTDTQRARSLVDALGDDAWPKPLPPPEAGPMLASLGSPQLDDDGDEQAARPAIATDEDASLAVPEDVNPELLEGLLQELPVQAEAFSSAIQNLIAGGGADGMTSDVDVAQRVAHTLKGAGNTVGVPGIANVTHHLEDILLALRNIGAKPSSALGDLLMTAADCLESMSEYLTGSGARPGDVKSVLQRVLDWANRADREGSQILTSGEAAPAASSPAESGAPSADRSRADADSSAAHRKPEREAPRGVGPAGFSREEGDNAVGQMVRVPAALVDNLLRLVGETIILTGQVHERLRGTHEQARALISQFDLLRQLGGELEAHIDVADLSGSSRRAPAADARGTGFDALELDEYNELHSVSRRLVEAAIDAREVGQVSINQLVDLEEMLATQARLNRETQEAVLRTRMVPVKNVLPRLQRAVRQTCRLTGKRVEADFLGGETLMDSDVLNNIVDPLMHLVRNAIDHGIELPEVREAAGKAPAGTLTLEFARDGNQIMVRCVDDGGGINFERIREKASVLGLIGEDVEATEQELLRLLFRPNFSTRDEVTQVSGRGVGLDAVYSRIVELGGSIEVHSELGQSCTVDVRLPVTLISTHALLVRPGEQTIALANRGLEQILHAESGELKHVGDELVFELEDETYPAKTLESVLGLERPGAAATDRRPVVLVRGEAGLSAVLPEAVVGSRELVVKGLGQYIPKLRGIIGATILGDGSVTPVLDLPDLLRAPARSRAPATGGSGRTPGPSAAAVATDVQSVLVVDDSLSARRSLAQVMKDYGYDVRTARDGLEAVTELEQARPDLLLTDLEMPRMNGMELARHARARSATVDLPIVMVTSRSTVKHREQAEAAGVNVYLTKPFSEEELIDHVARLLRVEPRRASA
ncbi:MAG: hybrid sensor histidine kinase/response regulator, partial [Gammaproteobacteria bacterium]